MPKTDHLKLGLTGGISCGKSLVGRHLESLGWLRVDSDQVAREIVKPGTPGYTALVEYFGPGVLGLDGTLNRKALGQIVFADPHARKTLEGLLHPLIWERISECMGQAEMLRQPAVFEIPLLIENNRQNDFSEVWVVASDPTLQRTRLMRRDHLDEEEVDKRILSQMPIEEKVSRADRVFWNNGTREELLAQVDLALKDMGSNIGVRESCS